MPESLDENRDQACTTMPDVATQFSLTAEQLDVQELARTFTNDRIVPNAAAWDRNHHFDRSLYTALGELGFMGVCVPEALGGAGMDFLSYILVLEELSRGDA